ncbi:MAG: ABC transporter ATP-binding protein [Acidobacteria bacterium]|nr:MAG: ABC transporter ATP-binding protein [Acidobacteriota bacterium]
MRQPYKEAFLKALDKAYPGWLGDAPRTALPASERTENQATKASGVDLTPGAPQVPAGTARTGRESQQRAQGRLQPWISKIANSLAKLSQPNSMNLEETLRYFLHLLRPYWRRISLTLLGMVLDAMLGVLRPWPLKVVVDRVLTHKPSRVPLIHQWLDAAHFTSMQIVYGCCAAVLLIAVITGITAYCYTRLIGNIGQHFVFDLRGDLFAHMQRLSLRFHDAQKTGDLTTRLTSDIQSIQDFITNGFVVFCSNTLLLTGMAVLMFWVNWRFALATLSVTPLMFWLVYRNKILIKRATRKARASTGLLAALAQETLASIRIVQGLAQEDQIDDRFQAQSENTLEAFLESIRYQARIAPVVDFLSAIGLTTVMWYGARSVLTGQLTTGDVILFFAYVNNFYSPMKAISRSANTFTKATVGAERIVEVLQHRSEVRDRKRARPAPQFKGAIAFRNVSFGYESGVPVLSNINLSIAPGQKLAIVGATGAGKSTLVSLIPRFYDPSEGAIVIDGEDIRNYSLQSLREQISLVLQDSLLLSGTIRDNITFGRMDASDQEISAAARTANADEFIRRLPDGYDTRVGERGTTLSGGQKQRIAIARAVLRNAPILILDEPTSGLDAAAERTVINALERAAAGRTTLIIAHRLSTVRLADRIVVLEGARIAEEGTHEELLARNGRYAHLYRLQVSPREALGITPENPGSNPTVKTDPSAITAEGGSSRPKKLDELFGPLSNP